VEPCCLACDNHTARFSCESPLIAERAAEVISNAPQDAHWNSTLRDVTSASKAIPAQTGQMHGKYRLSNDTTFTVLGSLSAEGRRPVGHRPNRSRHDGTPMTPSSMGHRVSAFDSLLMALPNGYPLVFGATFLRVATSICFASTSSRSGAAEPIKA